MAGRLPMGQKELLRSKTLEMVRQGKMSLIAASSTLRISYRQAIRLYAKYRREGDAGLIHGNYGKPSNNRITEKIKGKILEAYKQKYCDFGPTFACEKLSERDGIKIPVSTLRRILITEGLWKRKKRSREYRSRRERKAYFGELIQFDGSHHRWFEERGGVCCLMTMIDDATNIRYAQFFEQETTESAMTVLSYWIKKYGIPERLYCDKKNAFVLTREPSDKELLAGITKPKSHFGRVCEKLGIEVIPANSPQAKGRVERNHGVDQDRLVKELRLTGISTIREANRFLEETYLPQMNRKFSRPPSSPCDRHVPIGKVNLHEIMSFEYERTVSNDYVVRFNNRLIQILKTNKFLPRPKDNVIVRILLDGQFQIIFKDSKLHFKEINQIKGQLNQDVA